MQVKVAQGCLTLRNPMDCTVRGIIQARILEWIAFPFPGDLPKPGIKPSSPTLWGDSLPAEPSGKPIIAKVWSNSRDHQKVSEETLCGISIQLSIIMQYKECTLSNY